MIIGHGIDLIEINRVSTIYQKFNHTFVDKYFALDNIDEITPKLLSNNFAISRNIFPGTNGTDWSILNCKNGLTVLRPGDLGSTPLIPIP